MSADNVPVMRRMSWASMTEVDRRGAVPPRHSTRSSIRCLRAVDRGGSSTTCAPHGDEAVCRALRDFDGIDPRTEPTCESAPTRWRCRPHQRPPPWTPRSTPRSPICVPSTTAVRRARVPTGWLESAAGIVRSARRSRRSPAPACSCPAARPAIRPSPISSPCLPWWPGYRQLALVVPPVPGQCHRRGRPGGAGRVSQAGHRRCVPGERSRLASPPSGSAPQSDPEGAQGRRARVRPPSRVRRSRCSGTGWRR